jgi:hypothetical protein
MLDLYGVFDSYPSRLPCTSCHLYVAVISNKIPEAFKWERLISGINLTYVMLVVLVLQ